MLASALRILGLLLIPGLLLLRGEVVSPDHRAEDQLARSVRELGARDFKVRERAMDHLQRAGLAARPALRRALRSKDPEIRRRARQLLIQMREHLIASAPPGTAELVRKYYAEEAWSYARIQAFWNLLGKGGAADEIAVDLLADEADRPLPEQLARRLAQQAPSIAAVLLDRARPDKAEMLFDLVLANPSMALPQDEWERDKLPRHYATLLLLRGNLDARIPHLEALAAGPRGEAAANVLTFLYIAKRDWVQARKAAGRANRPRLLELVLREQGDWESLAHRPLPTRDSPGIMLGQHEPTNDKDGERGPDRWAKVGYLGLRAGYCRLAGHQEKAERVLAEVRRNAEPDRIGDRWGLPWRAAAVLLLNDRPPADALALLERYKDRLRQFELRCARLEFREAFELDDHDCDLGPRQMSWLYLARARAFLRLGERARAIAALDRVFTSLKKTRYPETYCFLLDAEAGMGLKEKAFEDCLRVFALHPSDQSKKDRIDWYLATPGRLADSFLRPGNRIDGETWWKVLDDRSDAEKLHRLRAVHEGKVRGIDLTRLLQQVEGIIGRTPDSDRDQWYEGLADLCSRAGRRDLARTDCQKWVEHLDRQGWKVAASYREPLQRLAALAADEHRWADAAQLYRRLWELAPEDPWPYYLSGEALVRAGQTDEGRRRMRVAHWLPLGNQELRLRYARHLADRGERNAAAQECEFGLRLGGVETVHGVKNGLLLLASRAAERGDDGAAAAWHERLRLLYLEYNLSYLRTGLYLVLPYRVHVERARALLKAGRTEEALREIRLGRALLPANVDLPIATVPLLEAGGRFRDADELFNTVFSLRQRLCADYPRCAWCHHELAWLAVRCRRQLDDALEHARRAVELDPGNAAYLDTLAEVYFQRGEKERALELAEKSLRPAPRDPYFQKQARRLAAGDAKASLPAEVIWVPKTQEACLLDKDIASNGPVIKGRGELRGDQSGSWNSLSAE